MKSVILVIAGILGAPSALACTCGKPESTEAAIESATHVFRARVISLNQGQFAFDLPDIDLTVGGLVRADFEVISVLKGDPIGFSGLYTTAGGWVSCGVPIALHTEYVFFVNVSHGIAFTGMCSGYATPRESYGLSTSWSALIQQYGLVPNR